LPKYFSRAQWASRVRLDDFARRLDLQDSSPLLDDAHWSFKALLSQRLLAASRNLHIE
jgi:hypothetical protein